MSRKFGKKRAERAQERLSQFIRDSAREPRRTRRQVVDQVVIRNLATALGWTEDRPTNEELELVKDYLNPVVQTTQSESDYLLIELSVATAAKLDEITDDEDGAPPPAPSGPDPAVNARVQELETQLKAAKADAKKRENELQTQLKEIQATLTLREGELQEAQLEIEELTAEQDESEGEEMADEKNPVTGAPEGSAASTDAITAPASDVAMMNGETPATEDQEQDGSHTDRALGQDTQRAAEPKNEQAAPQGTQLVSEDGQRKVKKNQ